MASPGSRVRAFGSRGRALGMRVRDYDTMVRVHDSRECSFQGKGGWSIRVHGKKGWCIRGLGKNSWFIKVHGRRVKVMGRGSRGKFIITIHVIRGKLRV